MGNKNEGYLGGIMGGESRVESGVGLKSTGILSLEEAGTQTVEVASPTAYMEVLLVGGGGGGASGKANSGGTGGGGAGEITYASGVPFTENVTITVGDGGAGGAYNADADGTNGGQSAFSPGGVMEYNAVGGGGGGKYNSPGKNSSGGSGGGGGAFSKAGGTGVFSGGDGGDGTTSDKREGGGGGGAGGAGASGSSGSTRTGGDGVDIYSTWGLATSTGFISSGVAWFGGGGGGGGDVTRGLGSNGGGNGGIGIPISGSDGVDSSGSGGGGAGNQSSVGGAGGAGGKGVVIVRYSGPPVLTGGDTTVESGGYTYHTFTSSGTLEGPTSTETLTLPQLSWGGITGRSVLTEGSAGVPGDDDWNDVSLLISGSGVTAGSSVTDLSTAGNNHTSVSTSSLSTTGPYGTTQGVLDFDGTNDWLRETTASGNFKFGTDDFTIEFWAKCDVSNSSYVGLIDYDKSANTTQDDYFVVHLNGNEYSLWTGDGNILAANTTATNWNHIAITRQGTSAEMFINGVSVDTTAASGTSLPTNMTSAVTRKLYIGRQWWNTDLDFRCFNGKMADIRITRGVARDIAADWAAGLYDDPPLQNLPVAGTPDTLVDTGIFTLEEIYELTKST